jgi:hypothetical protein
MIEDTIYNCDNHSSKVPCTEATKHQQQVYRSCPDGVKMCHSPINTKSTERCMDFSPVCPLVRRDWPENMWEVSPTTTMVSWVESSKGGMVLIPSIWMMKSCDWTTTDLRLDDEREDLGQERSIIFDDILGIVADDYIDKLVEDSSGLDGGNDKCSTVDDDTTNIDSDTESRSVGTKESVFETFDDVSILTEDSILWDNVDADFGMEDDQFTYALEQGTIFEHVLAALKWDKSEESSKSSPRSWDYMVLGFPA